MPVKKRNAKVRAHRITPEAVAAFKAGDSMALDRALGLRPWEPSPLETDDPEPPTWARNLNNVYGQAWPWVYQLRCELEKAAGGQASD